MLLFDSFLTSYRCVNFFSFIHSLFIISIIEAHEVKKNITIGVPLSGEEFKDTSCTTRYEIGEIVSEFVQMIASYSPDPLKQYLLEVAPVLSHTAAILEIFWLLIKIVINLLLEYSVIVYHYLSPYEPALLAPVLIGLIICFFGGSFMTIIAAYEAFKMVGYESMMTCITNLKDDFQKVLEASKKEDEVDILPIKTALVDSVEKSSFSINASTSEMQSETTVVSSEPIFAKKLVPAAKNDKVSSKEMVSRKMLLFIKTIDPHRFTENLLGINAGVVAIIATMKIQFAKTIALGNSISKMAEPPAKEYLLPILESFLPEEYRNWASFILMYSIKTISISIAWSLKRVLSSFHSAIRGGVLFARYLFKYLHSMNLVSIDLEDSAIEKILGHLIACLGLWFQLTFGFKLPYPLNFMLFPVTLVEYFLVWVVNNSNFIIQNFGFAI